MAPHDLPGFLPGPDGSDPLFTAVVILLLLVVLVVGNLYLKLHAIPEQIAHRQNNTQLQFIAVLTLLALFTHNNVFWVAALLLAVVRLPDFSTPIHSIATSLEKLAADKTAPAVEGETPAGAEKETAQSEAR